MNIKASGRSALMVAATIWLWCAGPLHAQETTEAAPQAAAQQATVPNPLQQLFGIKPAATEPPAAEQPGRPIILNKYRKTSAHHSRKQRSARSHQPSRNKATAENKAASQPSKDAANKLATVADADNAAPLPASATNADAGAQSSDNGPADAAPAPQPGFTAAEAHDTGVKTEAGVIPSDELNEVDRAASATAKPAPMPTLALASVNPPEPVTTGQAASAGDDNSSWARASLIGKIFIGFGGLLMLASAARMLMG